MSLGRTNRKGTAWALVALVLWTAVLIALMIMPLAENPIPHTGIWRYWDKMAHIVLFGVTGFIGVYGARFFSRFGSRLTFGLFFSLFLAFGTEFAQRMINYRSGDFYDLMADLLGIFGVLFVYVVAYMNEGIRSRLKL